MKIPNPKKLSINEIYKLYNILKVGISKEIGKDILEEAHHIIENISNEAFKESLSIMYGDKYTYKKPMVVAVMFIHGLKKNDFFKFVIFVRTLSHGN